MATSSLITQILATQDAELANVVNELKTTDCAAFQQFVQNQQNKIYTDIKQSKNNTINKVFSDLDRASNAHNAFLLHNKRNEELIALQQQIAEDRASNATAVVEDKNMATRKHEMNDWTVNNKEETLFVMTAIFIMLSGLLALTAFWRMGWISSSLWVGLGAPLILIAGLILVRRMFYTQNWRNKRYWNKQIFEGTQKKIPIPSCEEMADTVASL